MERYDLLIVGAGSAGFYGALKADALGARVALIERAEWGGTCPNRGCLPTKHLVTAGERYFYGQTEAFHGVEPRGTVLDVRSLMTEKDAVIRFAQQEKQALLDAHPTIRPIRGEARVTGDHSLTVDGRALTADAIVLATGASPVVPDIPGLRDCRPWTSDRVHALIEFPAAMIVIGGGEIGLEYGQCFLHFGVRVTVLEREERILPREEPEVSAALRRYLEQEGMEVRTGVRVRDVRGEEGSRRVLADVHGEGLEFEAPVVFVATGRRPNTDSMGLEAVGVRLRADGAVHVDSYFQTDVPSIYAAGDVLGHVRMLSSVADREGELAVENALHGTRHTMDYRGIPYAILTSPQTASVGLKEAEARAAGLRVKVSVLNLRDELPKATADRGLVKLVVEEGTERILGVHVLAAKGGEAIHEAIFIVKHGMTIAEVARTVHVYPIVAESILRAAESYAKAA